jgi:hypothetical protein
MWCEGRVLERGKEGRKGMDGGGWRWDGIGDDKLVRRCSEAEAVDAELR